MLAATATASTSPPNFRARFVSGSSVSRRTVVTVNGSPQFETEEQFRGLVAKSRQSITARRDPSSRNGCSALEGQGVKAREQERSIRRKLRHAPRSRRSTPETSSPKKSREA